MESSSNNCSFTSGGESRSDQSTEFFELSAFIAELSQKSTNKLTNEQWETLKNLTNKLLEYLVKKQQESDANSLSVFKLLSYSFSLFSNQSKTETESEKIERLENEISDLKDQLEDAEPNLIQELSEKLHLIGVHSKSDFIDQAELVTTAKQQLIDDLTTALDLPPTTNPLNVVALIQNKLDAAKTQSDFLFTAPPNTALKTENNNDEKVQELKSKIKSLKRQLQEGKEEINVKDQQIAELENAVTTLHDTIVNNEQALNNHKALQSQLETAKADISSLAIQLESAKKSIEKKKRQNGELKSTISQQNEQKQKNEIEIKVLKDENAKLKEKINGIIVKKEADQSAELEKQLSKAQSEKEQLLALIDNFTELLDQQAHELEQETNSRNELVTALHKSTMLNHELEERYKQAESQLNNNKSNAPKSLFPLKESGSSSNNSNNKDLFDIIDNINRTLMTINNKEVKENVQKLVDNDEMTNVDKINNAFLTLSQNIKPNNDSEQCDYEKIAERSNLLENAFISIVKFVEKLAGSGDVMQWIPSSYSPQDLRSTLLSEIAKINAFIQENAAGIVEESQFFDELSINNNYSDFEKSMQETFEKYRNLKTEEGKDLMVLLAQAIVANDVLRKFANEAKLQCEHQISELTIAKNEAEIERQELLSKHRQETSRLHDELLQVQIDNGNNKEKLETVVTILEKAASNDPNVAKLLETIKENNIKPSAISDENFIKSFSFNGDEQAIIEQLKQKIKEYEDEKQRNKERQEKETAEQLNQIEIIKKELSDSLEQMNALHQENQALNQQVVESKQENLKSTSSLKDQLIKVTCQMEKLKEKCATEVTKAQKENRALVKKLKEVVLDFEETKQQMKLAMKKKIAKITAQKEEEVEQQRKEVSTREEKITDLESQLQDSNQQIHVLEGKLENLNAMMQDQNEVEAKLKLSQKMLTTKIAAMEDKIRRDKTTYDSQLKLKAFAIETDAQAKIDANKAELNNKLQTILRGIYSVLETSLHSFKDDSVEPMIDEECIKLMIEALHEKAEKAEEMSHELKECKEELESIKYALGATAKGSNPIQIISNMVEKVKEQSQEIVKLNEEYQQMKKNSIHVRSVLQQEKLSKEWEEWARKLLYLVNDGTFSVKSAKEIRFAVEECIYVALKNKIIWRRLDTLRDEKKLILHNNLNTFKTTEKNHNLGQLISIVKFVKLIQKLSGHIKTELSYAQSLEQLKQAHKQTTIQTEASKESFEQEKQPLFTNFVVKQNENKFRN